MTTESQLGPTRSTWHPRAPPASKRSRADSPRSATPSPRSTNCKNSVVSNNYVEPTKLTVAQYLDRHWLPAVRADVRSGTWVAYEAHARLYISPMLGDIQLQGLTRQQVRAFYKRLADEGGARGPLSSKSIHNVHLTLHKALADAVEDRLLQHNPADKGHRLSTDRPEMRVWSPDEMRVFLGYVAESRLFAMWRLAATTGMRRGELLGLRWSDVDLDTATVTVAQTRIKGQGGPQYGRPKTRRGRRVLALDAVTVAALRARRVAQVAERLASGQSWIDEGLVFTRKDGSPLDPDVASQTFERHGLYAGLPRIRFHDLRHSYATAALRAGVPVKVVSERLGHASVAFTMDVYQHVIPGMDQDAADRIAGILDA